MPAQIKFNKLKAQAELFDDDKTKTILFSGGLGSGKTYALCMKALKLSYINKGYAGGILCPSYSDFKKDVFPTIIQVLEENKVKYRYHKQDKVFMFPWSKAPLYVFTGEKPIAGPNLAYCLINEHSLMQYDRISEMLRRVRIKRAPAPQRVLCGTPEDRYGWLMDWVEAQQAVGNFKIVYADTSENVHIDQNYRKELEALLDDEAMKIFAEGQIVRIGGDYFYYAFSRKRNIDRSVDFLRDHVIHVGLDFNVGNMSATFSHKVEIEHNKYAQHFFDELVLKGDSNTYQMCTAIKARYPSDWKDNLIITCDASGKNRSTSARTNVMNDVGILREAGFEVRLKRANIRMRKRQLLVNGMLSHGLIRISPECKLTIKDLEKVQQNRTDFTKIKDKDNKLTHLSDTIDYVMDYEYSLVTEKQRTRVAQL